MSLPDDASASFGKIFSSGPYGVSLPAHLVTEDGGACPVHDVGPAQPTMTMCGHALLPGGIGMRRRETTLFFCAWPWSGRAKGFFCHWHNGRGHTADGAYRPWECRDQKCCSSGRAAGGLRHCLSRRSWQQVPKHRCARPAEPLGLCFLSAVDGRMRPGRCIVVCPRVAEEATGTTLP